MAKPITTQTFKIQLETLTPLHIGSGRELMKGLDFFYDGNNKIVGKVNQKKLYPKYIDNIDKWSATIMDGEDIYQKFLQKRQVPLKEVCDEILPVRYLHGGQLKEFIRNGMTQNPVIAGSSIKGAIRTALLSDKLNEYYKSRVNELIRNFNKYRKFDTEILKPVTEIKQTDKKHNPQNDIFKYIQVSDAEGKQSQLFVDIFQTLNTNRDENWYIKKSLTQSLEVFEGEVNFSICINDEFWEKNKFGIRNVSDFFAKIHQHNKELLEKELDYFKNDLEVGYFSDNEIGGKIIEAIENLLENLNENDILLRMSAGSGWDFMTGAWLKKVTNNEQWEQIKSFLVRDRRYVDFPFPKTRRLTSEYKLPGFVKLSLL